MEQNFYEFLSLGLAVAVGVAGVIAFIYRKGQANGIDIAHGKKIEEKVNKIDEKIDTAKKEGDAIHNELKEGLQQVSKDVSKLTGSFETFKQMVNKT